MPRAEALKKARELLERVDLPRGQRPALSASILRRQRRALPLPRAGADPTSVADDAVSRSTCRACPRWRTARLIQHARIALCFITTTLRVAAHLRRSRRDAAWPSS